MTKRQGRRTTTPAWTRLDVTTHPARDAAQLPTHPRRPGEPGRSRALEEERPLHPVPAVPHTVAFGVTRTVPGNTPMVAFEGGQYSVPHTLLGETVWVRVRGQGGQEQVVIVHVEAMGRNSTTRYEPHATPGTPGRSSAPH